MIKIKIIVSLIYIFNLIDMRCQASNGQLQNDNSNSSPVLQYDPNIFSPSGGYKAYPGGVLPKRDNKTNSLSILSQGYYLESNSSNARYLFVMQYGGVAVFLQQNQSRITVIWRNGAAANGSGANYGLYSDFDQNLNSGILVVAGDDGTYVTVGTFSGSNCDLQISSGKFGFSNCDVGRDGLFVVG